MVCVHLTLEAQAEPRERVALFAAHAFHGIIKSTVPFPPRLVEAYPGPSGYRRAGGRLRSAQAIQHK